MKSYMIHITTPVNIGAIVIDQDKHFALRQLTDLLNLTGQTIKFRTQEINWVKTDIFDKPRVLFYK